MAVRPSFTSSFNALAAAVAAADGTAGGGNAAALLQRFQESAARRLQALLDQGIVDTAELQRSIDRAEKLKLPEELVAPAQERLRSLELEASEASKRRSDAVEADQNRSAAARKRHRSLGVDEDGMQPPPEFVCPITQEKMCDPVVASDGHSYEREAIMRVIHGSGPHGTHTGAGLSPLTREKLRHELFPNVALRKRIAEHETELADQLERFAARLKSQATPNSGAGGSSSNAGVEDTWVEPTEGAAASEAAELDVVPREEPAGSDSPATVPGAAGSSSSAPSAPQGGSGSGGRRSSKRKRGQSSEDVKSEEQAQPEPRRSLRARK